MPIGPASRSDARQESEAGCNHFILKMEADLPGFDRARGIFVSDVDVALRRDPCSPTSGSANGILWPEKFETYRRQIMSASIGYLGGEVFKGRGIPSPLVDMIVKKLNTPGALAAG